MPYIETWEGSFCSIFQERIRTHHHHHTITLLFLDLKYLCCSDHTDILYLSKPSTYHTLYLSKLHLNHTADKTWSHGDVTTKCSKSESHRLLLPMASVDGLSPNPVFHSAFQFPHL